MNLAYRFKDPSLLELALTHSSTLNESGGGATNERLEHLGDAVLQLVVTEWLYAVRPSWPEGDLTRGRQGLVNSRTFAGFADQWQLGPALRVGKGERSLQGSLPRNIRADAFEAVVGAIYLDGGLAAVRAVVVPLLDPALHAMGALGDPRSQLQDWCQARKQAAPTYEVVGRDGPDHALIFTATVTVGGQQFGPAAGASKQLAFAEAARIALAAPGIGVSRTG